MPEHAKILHMPITVGVPVMLAFDETEVSTTNTTATTVKYFTFLKSSILNYKLLKIHAELKVSSGTGYAQVVIDGSVLKEEPVSDTEYKLHAIEVSVANIGFGIHTFELKLYHPDGATIYNKGLEVVGII